jgi:3-hydroxybutyryl-CoA dehydrogenase
MKTAGIIGAGTMGGGIAQVAASAGWSVLLFDSQPGMALASLEKNRKGLLALAAKGKI